MATDTMADELLTTDEVAARLKLNAETIRKWIRVGKLRALNFSAGSIRGDYRIRASELEKFLAASVTIGPEPTTPRRRRKASDEGVTQYF